MPKPDPNKVAAEIQSMQQELKNLQNAIAELVDAMITEEKPGPKQIKKLRKLKKEALSESIKLKKVPEPMRVKAKQRKRESNALLDGEKSPAGTKKKQKTNGL